MGRVVKGRAEPGIPLLVAVADFAQAHDPDYSRVRLLVALGWLRPEDVLAYVEEHDQLSEDSLAMARRIIAFLRTPGVLERLAREDTPAARELLDMARRIGLVPNEPGDEDKGEGEQRHGAS